MNDFRKLQNSIYLSKIICCIRHPDWEQFKADANVYETICVQFQDSNQVQSEQAYHPLYLNQQQHFKQLQQQELQQLLHQKAREQQQPWQQQRIKEQQWEQQQHLQMHQIAQAPRQKTDVEHDQNQSTSKLQEWNTHPVLPPIGSKDTILSKNIQPNGQMTRDCASPSEAPKHQYSGPSFPTENPLQKLLDHLPQNSYLPTMPVHFSKEEELYLRRLILQGLKDFNSKKLKDLYMDLTGYDKSLTGFVEYHDLSLLLSKYQVCVFCFYAEEFQSWISDDIRHMCAYFRDKFHVLWFSP